MPYINGSDIPIDPESLMRSRYSAYSMSKIDYIVNTMRGKPLLGFDKQEAENWVSNISWLDLEVIQSDVQGDKGFVEFIARFMERNTLKHLHELSEFQKINNRWYYIDGHPPKIAKKPMDKKISRNTPCPCDSKKKYKNCHGKDN